MRPREELALESGIADIVNNLRRAKQELDALPHGALRDRLELLLTRAELGVSELRQLAATGLPPAHLAPMADHEFEALRESVQKKWPDRERLATIRALGTAGLFSSAQAAALLKTFDFDNERVEAAVLLHSKLTDPAQFFQVLDAFAFSNSAQKVRERLNLG